MKKTLIIAEAGVNHNGDLAMAKKMVDVAVDAGVDFVKFQTFKSENLVAANAMLADYQKKNTNDTHENQLEMLKSLELSHENHMELIEYCKVKKVGFFSTAFDEDSVKFLKTLNLGFWKVPSGEITNLPYLELIASYNQPTIVSTGMCNFSDVEEAIQVLIKGGLNKDKITVLHCNTEYPTPFEDVNLNAMAKMGRSLDLNYGYSDHTLGIEVPIAAVALGAQVIEKHFTLDRNLPGPDHKASLEPHELKAMVSGIRNIEKALGLFDKVPSASEIKNRLPARKSIVAKNDIKAGEIFSANNLTTRRPGKGISPMKWYDYIGKPATRDYKAGDFI